MNIATNVDELAQRTGGGMTLEAYAAWLLARTHDVEFDIEQHNACSAAVDRTAPTAPPPAP